MKLSTLGVDKGTPDLVTPFHEAWLKANHNVPKYTPEAMSFMVLQMRSEGRERSGGFSASSLGSCPRQQQLTFLGLPQVPLRPRQIQVAHNGSWMHLRWQMAGLSAGWLAQAEVKIPDNDYDLSGTMDGILATGEGLELKSCNAHAYRGVKTFGIKQEHKMQIHTYMLATGINTFAVIYENKDTQDWVEIVVDRDEKLIDAVEDQAAKLWEASQTKTLFPMIDKCVYQEGWQYDWCSYREACPKAVWNESGA